MEADNFDRLMADKLEKADVPQYTHSRWMAFQAMLPASKSFGLLGINVVLLLLLLTSNAFWAWKFVPQKDSLSTNLSNLKTLENLSNKTMSPQEVNQKVIVYDTLYKTITVKKTVIKYVENTNVNKNYSLSLNSKHAKTQPASFDNSKELNKANSSNHMLNNTSFSDKNDNLYTDIYDINAVLLGAQKADTTNSVTNDSFTSDSTASNNIAINKEGELKEQREEKKKCIGTRWLAASHIGVTTNASNQSVGQGLRTGLCLEYRLNNFLSLQGSVSYFFHNYKINNADFSQSVLDDNYQSGGVYGTNYSWGYSDLIIRSLQAGIGIKLSLSNKSKFNPYVSSIFLTDLTQGHSLTNHITENTTKKSLLVESALPQTKIHRYIKSAFGFEYQLNYSFIIGAEVGFWKQTSGNPYTEDLFSGTVKLQYIIK